MIPFLIQLFWFISLQKLIKSSELLKKSHLFSCLGPDYHLHLHHFHFQKILYKDNATISEIQQMILIGFFYMKSVYSTTIHQTLPYFASEFSLLHPSSQILFVYLHLLLPFSWFSWPLRSLHVSKIWSCIIHQLMNCIVFLLCARSVKVNINNLWGRGGWFWKLISCENT